MTLIGKTNNIIENIDNAISASLNDLESNFTIVNEKLKKNVIYYEYSK